MLAQPALSFLKLVEPTCERQRVGRVETMVTLSGVLWSGFGCRVWGGFDSAVRFAHVLAQPASGERKLVEPACSLCELVVSKPWWLGVGSAFRLRVVPTRAARSSRPGSTGFRGGKLVEPILTSVSEWVVSKPSCACLGT